MGRGGDEERLVRGHDAGVDRRAHVHPAQLFQGFRRGELDDVAVLRADIELALGEQGRGPDVALAVEAPERLARDLVEAVDEAREVGDEDQPLVDRGRRE